MRSNADADEQEVSVTEIKKPEKDKHLGLRIDSELHYKLSFLADYEGRSINGEVLYLIRKAVSEYENKNGRIDFSR